MHRWLLAVAGAAAVSLTVVGCGPKMVPVQGQVLLGDKPLTTGSVALHPVNSEDKSDKVVAHGTIDTDGNYKLSTDGQNGAPAGTYKAVIVAGAPKNPKDPYSIPVSLVNPKFTKLETTPLTVEVAEGNPPEKYKLPVTK